MLFYIQLINKTWQPPNLPEFLQNSTTNKPELEIKNGLRKLRAKKCLIYS
jgi:hypothetical protein